VNLELPFYQLPDAELDAYLERIDGELDALFLDAVAETFQAVRVEKDPPAAAVAAA
jgi:hypothetical protein